MGDTDDAFKGSLQRYRGTLSIVILHTFYVYAITLLAQQAIHTFKNVIFLFFFRGRRMLELILNSMSLRTLSPRRWKLLAFQRWKRSLSLLQVQVLPDLRWLQGTKATGSRRPVLVRRYENGNNHTAIADGLPEFAV